MNNSRPATPFTADPETISRLSRSAARRGITRLSVRSGDLAIDLRISAGADDTLPSVSATETLKSDCAGVLHWRHPDGGPEPSAVLGAGETFAYLEAGGIVLPQTAPSGGTLIERLGEDGKLVGFGQPLAILRPQS